MIILQESVSPQTFKFIPRSYTADTLVLTDEGTGVDTTYNITATRVDYDGNTDNTGTFLSITDTFTITENNYYQLVVKNGSTVIYKDKVFCTNQTVTSYSVNNGEFNTYTSDNDYIIYE